MSLVKPAIAALCLLVPAVAQAQTLTTEQLIALAEERDTCGDRSVVTAAYDTTVPNRVVVTCGDDAEGFVPALAGLGAGGAGAAAAGLALVAVAAGGGGSTPSTNATTGN